MNPGDIPFSVVNTQPMCIELLRGDGQYWDWKAGKFDAVPAGPFDAARWSLPLAKDPVNPEIQVGAIPAGAANSPQVTVIQAFVRPGTRPSPDASWWLGMPAPIIPPPAAAKQGRVVNAAGQMISFP